MTHAWTFSLGVGRVLGVCRTCGLMGYAPLGEPFGADGWAPCERTDIAHRWQLDAVQTGHGSYSAAAVCGSCGESRYGAIEEPSMGHPARRLDLAGDCRLLVTA